MASRVRERRYRSPRLPQITGTPFTRRILTGKTGGQATNSGLVPQDPELCGTGLRAWAVWAGPDIDSLLPLRGEHGDHGAVQSKISPPEIAGSFPGLVGRWVRFVPLRNPFQRPDRLSSLDFDDPLARRSSAALQDRFWLEAGLGHAEQARSGLIHQRVTARVRGDQLSQPS